MFFLQIYSFTFHVSDLFPLFHSVTLYGHQIVSLLSWFSFQGLSVVSYLKLVSFMQINSLFVNVGSKYIHLLTWIIFVDVTVHDGILSLTEHIS